MQRCSLVFRIAIAQWKFMDAHVVSPPQFVFSILPICIPFLMYVLPQSVARCK